MPYGAPPAGPSPYAGAAAPVGGNPYASPNPYAGADSAPLSAQIPGQAGQPAQYGYGYPAPPAGYAAPPAGVAAGYAAAMPGYAGAGDGTPVCRYCGSVPAVQATIRGHQGFLVFMRFLRSEGPFCRNCGISTHRSMTANSLWQGWWGIGSALINPITMLMNLPQRAKINKLAPPMPGGPGQPMNPGRTVFLRPAILGLLLPVLVLGAIVYSAQSDPSYASVGDCVHNKNAVASGATDTHPDVVTISCSDPNADARIVGKVKDSSDGEKACTPFADADGYYSQEQGSDRFTLCLHFLK